MRLLGCRLGTWSRRSVLMMSFWYFALIFSAFLYYAYAVWRPAVQLSNALFDAPVAGEPSGTVLLENRDMLRLQRAELKRILDENPSLAGRYRTRLMDPEGDTTAQTVVLAAVRPHQLMPHADPSSRNVPKKLSRVAPVSDAATNRTRNLSVAWGVVRDRVTNGRRVADDGGEDEDVMVEVEEGGARYPVTDEDLATLPFESTTMKPPLAPTVEGYERVASEEGLRLHCGRCAVVSSSGHLINKSLGHEIDSTQCVLRMNSAPTVGYEDDVGARTTVRVIGHVNMLVLNSSSEFQQEIFVNRTSRADKIIIPWLHSFKKLNKDTNLHYRIAKNFSKTFPDVEFYLLTPEKSKLAEELFKSETGLTTQEANTWLTTGWMTLLFAIDVCDEIDIYGLVDENYCRNHPNESTPYHYYDPEGIIECKYYQKSEERLTGGHLFITEKAVFARWAQRFNFSFHAPAWNLTASPATNRSLALETPFLKRFYEAKRNRTSGRPRKVVRRVIRRIVVKRKVPVVKKTKL